MAELSLVLKQCAGHRLISRAMAVHCQSLKLGTLSNLHFATQILVTYCKCGSILNAQHLFAEMFTSTEGELSLLDVVCWNSIISGCIRNGRDQDALRYFKAMQSYYHRHHSLMGPDSYTLSSILSSNLCLESDISSGQQLHGYATKTGILSGVSVGNALITFYAKWDRLLESRQVFEFMPTPNVVSWTALISGHAQHMGHREECLRLFGVMMRDAEAHRQRPNEFTLASIFSVCGSLASLSQGTLFISMTLKMGLSSNIHVQNSLIGFYSECGCLEDAKAVFDAIIEPDLISWNSLLKGYAQQGRGGEAFQILEEMHSKGATPDSITFLSLLSAFRHSGMVSEGLGVFDSMVRDHKIEPRTEHISCIIDLLGRAGHLRQAEEFIDKFRFEPSPSVWRTLLGACRVHGNAEELAESIAARLVEMEPRAAEAHIVLSHVYATRGRWEMVAKLRVSMKEKGVGKEPGFSWIEVGNRVHCFVAWEWGHPQMVEIVKTLMELTNNIKCVKE